MVTVRTLQGLAVCCHGGDPQLPAVLGKLWASPQVTASTFSGRSSHWVITALMETLTGTVTPPPAKASCASKGLQWLQVHPRLWSWLLVAGSEQSELTRRPGWTFPG